MFPLYSKDNRVSVAVDWSSLDWFWLSDTAFGSLGSNNFVIVSNCRAPFLRVLVGFPDILTSL